MAEPAFLAAIVESAEDAIIGTTLDSLIVSWNRGAERMYGYTADEVIGRPVSVLMAREWSGDLGELLNGVSNGDRLRHFETEHVGKDGTRLSVSLSVSTIKDPQGVVTGVSVIARDITERRKLEERLERQALYDPVTDLANRALFTDRLRLVLAGIDRRGHPVAMMIIDLDEFKAVNDSMGHLAGDRLLAEVGLRIRSSVRPSDTVARLGGDEFGVLMEEAGAQEAVLVAERIMGRLTGSFHIEGEDVYIGASMGIAECRDPSDADTLLRNADAALLAAKRRGKGSYEVYVSELHADVLKRLRLGRELRRAVEQEEFVLQYQPVVTLPVGEVIGVEALLRWNHPEHGLVPPLEFIPLAEESGLIVPIDRWVQREACRQAREWHDRFPRDIPLHMHVNISARQLHDPELVAQIEKTLRDSAIQPETLTLEITEGVLVHDTEATVAGLRRLRELGVRLAIDDFGIGFSSLNYLRKLPVDVVKIDRSFVAGVATNTAEWTLARGIIRMVHGLGLETVAEGIETAEQVAHLQALECRLGQGFYFHRPLEPERITALLEEVAQRPTASAS